MEQRTFDYIRDGLDFEHEQLAQYGISSQTFERYASGYYSSGFLRDRLAFALYIDGRIEGYMGISTTNEKPPMFYYSNFDPRSTIFGLEQVTKSEVKLVKDPLAVLSVAESGGDAICFLTEDIDAEQTAMLEAAKQAKQFTVS